MKRSLDFIASLFGIIILIPFIVIIVIFLRIFNGTPVLFVQQRIGLNGKAFNLFKFRTMTVDKNAEKGAFDAGSRARVTSIGKILRKTKLDELPQLFNVLIGDMSLVGPRPEVKKWVDIYPERWSYVHSVRPGITDPASIKYRHEEEILSQSANPEEAYKNEILPEKLTLYESYIQSMSIVGDFKIIIATFVAVFK